MPETAAACGYGFDGPKPNYAFHEEEAINAVNIDMRRLNFEAGGRIVLAGTIQFGSAIQTARQELSSKFPSLRVPQSKPLSPGETPSTLIASLQIKAQHLLAIFTLFLRPQVQGCAMFAQPFSPSSSASLSS